MCNAWNHPPGCNCGWGGVNYGTHGYGNLLSSRLGDIISCNSISVFLRDDEARTSPTSCPWCGASVYYHTNGYGDSVYFDSLGYPWPVHECFKRHLERKKALANAKVNIKNTYDFFDLSESQQKILILIGAARQIPNVVVGEFFIHKLTEKGLAKQMGISIEELRENYRYLYTQKSDGIKFLSDAELKQRKNQSTPQTLLYINPIIPSKTKETYRKPKVKSNNKTKRRQAVQAKSSQSNKLVRCPHCQQTITSDKLSRHIKNNCRFKDSSVGKVYKVNKGRLIVKVLKARKRRDKK